MVDSASHSADPTISDLYKACDEAFTETWKALDGDGFQATLLNQNYISQILDEYGRTRVWADQTKANLEAKARGSLDDVLRNDGELWHEALAILTRLKGCLERGTLYGAWVEL
jgi:hypothetical protein